MDLWDRLAGGLQEYVENYCLYKGQSTIKPSYDVDYEIECLDELQKHATLDDYWLHQISGCQNINDLPAYLQELVLQYLPRFFIKHPEYQNLDCLKISNLSFLDYGLPVEHASDVDLSEEIAKFREYCRLLGKKPEKLTEEELQRYYEIDNLFNEEMTSNEARSVFFNALEGKSEEKIKQIKIAYSEIIPKIIEKEMRLAEDGWMID